MTRRPTTQLDRAQWVARGLLRELHAVAPERAQLLEAQLVEAGERWLAARVDEYPPGEVVRVVEAARVLGVAPSTVWSWRTRGQVRRLPGGVLLEDCRAFLAGVPVEGCS